MVENDPLAGLDVGRDRLERNREAREVRLPRRIEEQRAGLESQLLPGTQATRLPQSAVAISELVVDEVAGGVLLPPEDQIAVRRPVVEKVDPVGRPQRLLDSFGGNSPGVKAPDHRPHARPGDGIDGDVKLLENLQDPDVRATARPATPSATPIRGQGGAGSAAPTGITARSTRANSDRVVLRGTGMAGVLALTSHTT